MFPPAPRFLDSAFLEGAGSVYRGPVVMGEDGMSFTLDPKN